MNLLGQPTTVQEVCDSATKALKIIQNKQQDKAESASIQIEALKAVEQEAYKEATAAQSVIKRFEEFFGVDSTNG